MSNYRINKALVIGSGVMGSGIAACLANVGIRTFLMDIVPSELSPEEEKRGLTKDSPEHRSRLPQQAIQKELKGAHSSFYQEKNAQLLVSGNIEDHIDIVKEVDWVIEVVTERLDIKQSVYSKIEEHLQDHCIVSSNTSGIPLKALTDGRSETFRKNFMVTHFFNPPRFMHLIEVVKGRETSPELYSFMKSFLQRKMGKGVVECKDTPNFIANRIGCYDLMAAVQAMISEGLSISEVDALAGTLVGRPKSAVFRLLDMVGIDVISHVVGNIGGKESSYKLPSFIPTMVEKGLLGSKVNKGFYSKTKVDGKSVIQVLNPETLQYQDAAPVANDEIKALKKLGSVENRLKSLLTADDKYSRFLWETISTTLCYAAEIAAEISDSVYDIDRAMRWGFNHQYGPFELWDLLGVENVVAKLNQEGRLVPDIVNALLKTEAKSFYHFQKNKSLSFCPNFKDYKVIPERPGILDLTAIKRDNTIRTNDNNSLIEINEDVLLFELHGKRNTLSIAVVQDIINDIETAEKAGKALVIGTQQNDFSVGADLKEMIGAAMSGQIEEFKQAIANFQHMTMRIKHSSIPVVAAIQGFTFGGGCEIAMHADARQISAETYIGLVECGVGLLPAGGGCKEAALRADAVTPDNADLFPALRPYFENIGMAKVSSCGHDIKEMSYSDKGDGISINREQVIHDACLRARLLLNQGYQAPLVEEQVRVGGKAALAELRVQLEMMMQSGFISEHDKVVGEHLAFVLCGGEVEKNSLVPQEYLLHLEREMFFQLLQKEKTQERIQHTLTNGKPLRN